MTDIDEKLNYNSAVSEWLLDLSDDQFRQGELEQALQYTYLAARALSTQNRDLTSTRVENNLKLAAGILADKGFIRRDVEAIQERPERCLHVLTEAFPAGGLTAMASRWMANDPARIHSVVLLSQEAPVPSSLRDAVETSGGRILLSPVTRSIVQRAIWLRRLAEQEASYVILHVEIGDIICGVAFGIAGGPPVLLVNHAAQQLWTGASIADRVVNCRGSELETIWSARYRGVGMDRCAVLPIPLESRPPQKTKRGQKEAFRKRLGIAEQSIIVLTVGSAFKYLPIPRIDFLRTWEHILSLKTNVVLIAVGFHGDKRWTDASDRVQNRIKTLGALQRADLQEVIEGSDVYVEAFPFGTTTALLEAGLAGLSAFLPPAEVPPPYATDGVAVDGPLAQPPTVAEYTENILGFLEELGAHAGLVRDLQASIVHHHTGDGWRRYLDAMLASTPRSHTPLSCISPARTRCSDYELWTKLSESWNIGYENAIETALQRAYDAGLSPRLTGDIKRECEKYHSLRRGFAIPLPVLDVIVNRIFPKLPTSLRACAFRVVSFLFRGGLLTRFIAKLKRLLGLSAPPSFPYQEYVTVRGKPEFQK